MRLGRHLQRAGQLRAGLAVVADHRAELLGIQRTVQRDHRGSGRLDLAVPGIVRCQAAGDDQRIAAPRAQQLHHLALGSRLIVGAGDQQLVAALAGTLLEQLGQTCVAGVFQVRDDEAERARLAAAQPGGLLVELEALLLGHCQHTLDGGRADSPLLRLAVEHIAGGGYRNVGEAGEVGQFQRKNPAGTCARTWARRRSDGPDQDGWSASGLLELRKVA